MVDELLTLCVDLVDAKNVAELFDEMLDVVVDVARPRDEVGHVVWSQELLKYIDISFAIFVLVLIEPLQQKATLPKTLRDLAERVIGEGHINKPGQ